MKTKRIEINEFYEKLKTAPIYLYDELTEIAFKFLDKENVIMKHEDGETSKEKSTHCELCTQAILQGTEINEEKFEAYGKKKLKDEKLLKTPKESKKRIAISDRKAYNQAVLESYLSLEEMEDQMKDLMIQLAIKDKWKVWSDEQAIGSIFSFNESALRNSGDKNVDLLVELSDKFEDIKERMVAENKALAQRLKRRAITLEKDEKREQFEALMTRENYVPMRSFTDEEIIFMAKYDLCAFCRKFPNEGEWYMRELNW